ncbi:MAG TPA: toll/interleukin-1 receptor domain-containing protein [Allosphingosinicella sp.]|nr:toll/interleukin-1 receptor domain-containing protein [Allosphingosinicella sp.]
MDEPAPGELRYKAFLSYSHKDSAAAARIHRRLESYRLPKRLVGQDRGRGPVPQRLAPIFRDRDEMAASADLSETVRNALAESAALIVLCSPAAAQSLWVSEEIRIFRRLHPGAPVLGAIIAGEPPDCFPEPLLRTDREGLRHEPLAPDFRSGADGQRLALMKLVAGATGVGLDDLVQRDASRRIRRVTAVTAVAVAAMLIMATLTVFAFAARQEAERQRTEVEGMIEFMLTDLREMLKGVGRLDALAAVNERAFDYYGRYALSDLSEDSQQRRARALLAIGEDELLQSRFDEAMRAFREAHPITASLLAAAPDDPARIYAHAQSEYWMGRFYEVREQWAHAEAYYRRYAAAARQLIALAPHERSSIMEMGFGAMNLGVVRLHGRGDANGAARLFGQAIHWFGRAAAAPAGDIDALREQANAYASLALAHYRRDRFGPALDAYRRQHAIALRIHSVDPANRDDLFRLAIAERAVALLSIRQGSGATGRALLEAAYQRSGQLVALDPANLEWRLLKVSIECDVLTAAPGSLRTLRVADVRDRVRAAIARLRAEGNPRVAHLSPCYAV